MTALVMQAAKGKIYGGGLAAVARIGGQCRAVCSVCGEEKPASDFRPQKRMCRECEAAKAREWFRLNPERAKAAARSRYAVAPGPILAAQKFRDPNRSTKRYRKNPEHAKAQALSSAARHPGTRRAIDAKRRSKKRNACPAWLTAEQLAEIRVICRSAKVGGRHVDHIIPLAGCRVCKAHGLHVPWNLQILSASENASKRNLCQDCWDAVRGGDRASVRSSHSGPPSNVADTTLGELREHEALAPGSIGCPQCV